MTAMEVMGALMVGIMAIGVGLMMTWVAVLVGTLWPLRGHWGT